MLQNGIQHIRHLTFHGVRAEKVGKDGSMTNSMSSLLGAGLVEEMAAPVAGQKKRRRIDPKTGQALVALGHAIEYLADEFIFEAGTQKPDRGQLDAIHILMAKNRDLYLACPEVPTFRHRLRSLLHIRDGGPAPSSELRSKLSHGRV